MKKLLFGGIIVVACFSAPASAAPAYNWTGFYAGVEGGGGWGRIGLDASFVDDAKLSGVLGGVQAGYNQQFGNWVVGVGADINAANIRGSMNWGAEIYSGKINYFGAIEGRGGYLLKPDLLIYGTFGGAFANVTAKVDAAPLSFEDKQTMTGWTVGAGIEYAVTPNISTFVQYKHFGLGSTTFTLDDPASIHLKFDVVKGGFNFKFN